MMAAHNPGMPHGGMAYGQPMPGHGPNPGQAMSHMQMHPGASAPGAPHVSQAGPMMGMHPGMQGGQPGAPSQHALQHLTPQPQMFQNPQMQQAFANNPQALAAFQQQQAARQQQMLAHQRAQQQQMMQGQHHGNMNMGFGGGTPQFSQQQLAQMQGQNPQMAGVLTGHLAQQQHMLQQQNQLRLQQQQAHHAQQQAQQQAQHAALANTQHMAMQHAASQSSNQGQSTPQPQHTPQPPQPQMRPQPQTSAAQEAQSSPAQPPNPQQNTSQPQPTPQPAQAHPAGQPQPGQQGQQPQQNQQGGPQNRQAMQQTSQMYQQRAAMMQQRQQALQQAQQAQQQQQNRMSVGGAMSGASTLRLYQFADHISRYKASEQTTRDEQPWRDFVERFFALDGSLRHVVKDLNKNHSKQYEVLYPSLPRYFHIHYDGIDQIQILIEQPSERMGNAPGAGTMFHVVETAQAKFIYWFKNGTQLICTGKIWAIFSEDQKISTLHFETQNYEQYVSRKEIENVFSRSTVSAAKSPKMTKKANPRNQPQPTAEPVTTLKEIPLAPIGGYGVTTVVQSFFEINETMSMMSEIMHHVQDNPGMTPNDALVALANEYANAPAVQLPPGNPQQGQPQINLPPNGNNPMQMMQQAAGMPPGARTPGQMGMQQPGMPQNFMSSPAMNNQFLPGAMPGMNGGGSPHVNLNAANLNPGAGSNVHTPSPAQTHMQAPGMVQQMSQQGSTGSGASVNTSPNVTGSKRRRPSAVKTEDEGGGPEVNGVQGKVKQSPRVGQNKRVKS